jgi:hypothetical protein
MFFSFGFQSRVGVGGVDFFVLKQLYPRVYEVRPSNPIGPLGLIEGDGLGSFAPAHAAALAHAAVLALAAALALAALA